MAYNPGNRFLGPEMLARGVVDQAGMREQRKQDDALVKGFMQMHQASPELQGLIPVQDWGDVAPNQIKGWLQGLSLQQEQQQQAQAQQEQAQAQQQEQARGAALQHVLAQLGGQGQATPMSQYMQAAGGAGVPMRPDDIRAALQGLAGPRGYDLAGDGSMDTWLAPTGNQLNVGGESGNEGRQLKQLESLMTRPIGGSDWMNTIRLHDYININYEPDGTLKDGARPSPVAEEMLRQANRISQEVSGRSIFDPKPAAAAVEEDESGGRGRFGRAWDELRGRPSAAAPAVPAAPAAGEPVVAAGAPAAGEAVFATMEEAQAARARGYRGPAVIGGRRAVIE